MPNKLLGQHFLKNASVLRKIIAALKPEPGDVVFEIGPGHGELTAALAEKYAELGGGKIIAIEKDAELLAELAARRLKNVEVVGGDALEMVPDIKEKNYKLVGNIPYYLTGHLFREISELANKPSRTVFLIQKEVAERMTATPPHMNRLAASMQFGMVPKTLGTVSRDNFSPKPKVDSAIIMLEPKEGPAEVPAVKYFAAVRILFAQPRKTLLNNLVAGVKETGLSKDTIADKLSSFGIDPSSRPQNMRVEDILGITQWLDTVVAL